MISNYLEEKVSEAKGNPETLEKLIDEYTPFINSTIFNTTGKAGGKEYFTVGLEAFAEAVCKFDINKGKFLAFAFHVIRRRVIDELRRESKRIKSVPLNENEIDESEDMEINLGRKIEIAMLSEELKAYGISFDNLYRECPRKNDTRKNCIKAAKIIANDEELLDYMKTNRKLPASRVINEAGLSKKLLEKKRKYIIALTVINQNKYGYLKDFLF